MTNILMAPMEDPTSPSEPYSKLRNSPKLFLPLLLFLLSLSLSAQPDVEWKGGYGGTKDEGAFSVQESEDGGYIVAGHSDSAGGDVSGNMGDFDIWAVKLDGSGNIQWGDNYGGTIYESAFSVQQTSDQGFIMAESSGGAFGGNYSHWDCWILKLDQDGSISKGQ